MNDLSNLATEAVQETSMQLEIDNSEGPVLHTAIIPAPYKNVLLPMHGVEVEQGLFGILIKQYVDLSQYAIYANHFVFRGPTMIMVKIAEPCTEYYFSVIGTPVFKGREPGNLSDLALEEGTITKLKFNTVTDIHRMTFDKGTHLSICVIVPDSSRFLLDDPEWIWDLLNQYDDMIYKPPTPGQE